MHAATSRSGANSRTSSAPTACAAIRIFLHEGTRQLFAYAEIEDEARWEAIARTEVCQRWWKHMADVMPANPDHSPGAVGLKEVFHLD
jgi:L-rhamnose mutarotase